MTWVVWEGLSARASVHWDKGWWCLQKGRLCAGK